MTVRMIMAVALIALVPGAALAAEGSLRGSPASMSRQHDVAVQEELTFARTPTSVQAEVEAGTLTPLAGNENYKIANVSFAYAVPEVRLLVERLAEQYRSACGEPLVVTSLTRPKNKQPRNSHALSVHPAGMAVDFRVSQKAQCRSWLESTLLTLEMANVLDVTRERMPPHYHVAVYPTPYREYVARLEANKPKPIAVVAADPTPNLPIAQAAVAPAKSARRNNWVHVFTLLIFSAMCASTGLKALRRKRPQQR